jgi:hypothetical protein
VLGKVSEAVVTNIDVAGGVGGFTRKK